MSSPITSINQEHVNCTICLDEIDPLNNEENRRLDCSHIFHDRCIGQWFEIRHHCPVCRSQVEGIETPEQPFNPTMTLEELLDMPDDVQSGNQDSWPSNGWMGRVVISLINPADTEEDEGYISIEGISAVIGIFSQLFDV